MKSYLKKIKRTIFKPAILKNKVIKGIRQPKRRQVVVSTDRNEVIVIKQGENLKKTFQIVEDRHGAFLKTLFQPHHSILIKINLNTAKPYPASTSPAFLVALIDFLKGLGIQNIKVGDCSANYALPTMRVAEKAGILEAMGDPAEMVCFDRGSWVKVPINGHFLKHVTIPEAVYETDRIIALANMKTHSQADFSFGLKLGVGFMHPLERQELHHSHLQEKSVEINLAIQPDLTIIDGREAFISGGPDEGKIAECGNLIIGTDQIAVDYETYKLLYALKKKHGCIEHFSDDPFEMPQLRHGRLIGLGNPAP